MLGFYIEKIYYPYIVRFSDHGSYTKERVRSILLSTPFFGVLARGLFGVFGNFPSFFRNTAIKYVLNALP